MSQNGKLLVLAEPHACFWLAVGRIRNERNMDKNISWFFMIWFALTLCSCVYMLCWSSRVVTSLLDLYTTSLSPSLCALFSFFMLKGSCLWIELHGLDYFGSNDTEMLKQNKSISGCGMASLVFYMVQHISILTVKLDSDSDNCWVTTTINVE